MKTGRGKAVLFWVATAIVAFVLLSGGVADVVGRPETVAGMVALGYPLYFVTILGVWKVLGGIAILAPRFPRLKEWAYAGAFFDLTGAVASQAAMKDDLAHLLWPGFFALCVLVSWALRPPGRVLGSVLPSGRPVSER
jgi:uncharacterized membrane protein YphA (DoxX/SURF4 family)